MLIVLLGLVTLSSGVLGELDYWCDWDAINTCRHQFEQTGLNYTNQPFEFPVAGEYDEFCSNLETYVSCLEPHEYSCDPRSSPVAVLTGEIEALAFICGDGRDVFLGNIDCITREEVATGLKSCNTTLFQAFDSMKWSRMDILSKDDMEALREKYMTHIELTFECNIRTVEVCEEEVSEWMEIISEELLIPLAKIIGGCGEGNRRHRHGSGDHDDSSERDDDCYDWGSGEEHDGDGSPVRLIAGVIVGILFFVGLTIAAVLICAKRQALIRAQKARVYGPEKTRKPEVSTPYGPAPAMPTVGNKSTLPPVENAPTAPPEYGRTVAPPPYNILPPIGQTGEAYPV